MNKKPGPREKWRTKGRYARLTTQWRKPRAGEKVEEGGKTRFETAIAELP